jgi:signal transduction histidine kinase
MDALQALASIYRSNEPSAAVRALADGLNGIVPIRCVVWVSRDDPAPVCAHPSDVDLPPELVTIASHLGRPEVFPLESLSPVGSARFPDAEMLVLPLTRDGTPSGAVVLVADEATFGEAALEDEWREIIEALQAVAERHRLLCETQDECAELRKRTREMEALDVLGLAVNRTLDAGEVLTLVARFTRTLLGAHYAIVFTRKDSVVQAVATVGTGPQAPDAGDDPFARRVIEAGKPIVLGPGGEPFDPAGFPLHEAQKMRVGLGVPLALFGETFGALVVGYHDDYPVTYRDTLLALTLARHAAVAINNARLHSALEERSGELAEQSAELQHANQELRDLSLLKERFFNSVSHELRTPLNGILGYQGLLLEGVVGDLSDATREYVEKANRSASGMLRLVNEILDYGKIESGKLELVERAVTVTELIDDAVLTVAPLIDQKRLELESRIELSDGSIRTDPDRVRQILVNLLSNAIKFSPEGAVLALEAMGADLDGRGDGAGVMEFRVRDSGPGIEQGMRNKIFEEFEQIEGTVGGTGLGLPISRKLARLLGGDLVLESEVGQGSTFILRLPRRMGVEAEGVSSNAA